MEILLTLCARGGSKGLPDKNIKELLGKPLIAYSVEHARGWKRATKIVLSTDSERYADVGRALGVEVPFARPADLASDKSGKVPVLVHALKESERVFNARFDAVVDLDVSAPLRTVQDIERGYEVFCRSGADVCFSVTPARRSPYFNMVERDSSGNVSLCKRSGGQILSRQQSPQVWDLNASIYFYRREYLLKNPASLWDGKTEIFEMPEETVFDINNDLDFMIVEAIMKYQLSRS